MHQFLLNFLNEAQKEKYLWPVLEGQKTPCFAQTEPNAGGDPASMTTHAELDGDHYLLNGMKHFITGADDADFATVMCVTDKEKGARGGISCLLVDMDSEGVQVVRQQETMMDDRSCELAFTDVRVPAENLVGEGGDGFKMGQFWITSGHMRHGALSIGVAERALELAAS